MACPLAQDILLTVQEAQLPFKLDVITLGDGNCFARAVASQCQRPDVKQQLQNQETPIKNYIDLKKAVTSFMIRSRPDQVKAFRKKYQAVIEPVTTETWLKYWLRMNNDKEWVDALFVQGTAWYLKHDILIVLTTATQEQPFLRISGNPEDERHPCQGVPLILGCKNNLHYQSLLPLTEDHHVNLFRPITASDILHDMTQSSKNEEENGGPSQSKRNKNIEAEGIQHRGEPDSTVFKYEHPHNSFTLELKVLDSLEVQCPGCGQMMKQLVRHLKTDKKCKASSEQLEMISFEKQLKSYRHRKSAKKIQKDKKDRR